MRGNDFGSGFSQGFNDFNRMFDQQGRLRNENARTQSAIQMQKMRMAVMQEQLREMPQKLALQQQGMALQQQMMQIKLMQLKAQLDAKGNSTIPDELNPNLVGMSPNEKNNAIHTHGTPYQMYVPGTDKVAKFVFSKVQQNKDQFTMAAAKPLADALKKIAPGAQKFMNAPGQFKQYKAAITNYLGGHATPKDTQFLKDSGVTSAELMQLTENVSKLQQLAKTDATFNATYNMVAPQKGDTAETYAARLQSLADDFGRRYWEATFRDENGMPATADDGSDAAFDWLDQYVNDHMNAPNSDFNLHLTSEPSTAPQASAPSPVDSSSVVGGKSGHTYSADEINAVVKKTGKPYAEVIAVIKSKG